MPTHALCRELLERLLHLRWHLLWGQLVGEEERRSKKKEDSRLSVSADPSRQQGERIREEGHDTGGHEASIRHLHGHMRPSLAAAFEAYFFSVRKATLGHWSFERSTWSILQGHGGKALRGTRFLRLAAAFEATFFSVQKATLGTGAFPRSTWSVLHGDGRKLCAASTTRSVFGGRIWNSFLRRAESDVRQGHGGPARHAFSEDGSLLRSESDVGGTGASQRSTWSVFQGHGSSSARHAFSDPNLNLISSPCRKRR